MDVDTEFAFHTRRPSTAVEPPEVRPLIVDLPVDRPNPRNRAVADYLEEAQGFAAAPAPPERKSIPDVISTLADVTITGRGRVDGDGSEARIMLGGFDLESVPVVVAIPERNREAWVIASMDFVPPSFLPGTADLAVDGARTGRVTVPEGAAGRMRIPFGMTARLTSKKERFVGKSGSTWTGTGLLEDGYTLEITSALDTEKEITIRDRIPVPATDRIVLEVKKMDPLPTERDRENRLLWKMNIRPGETKKITVEYTLRYPGEEMPEYR
jgi:hypothetical protein